ncbi:MAG: molybdenum cofactor guanylyltransferase [Acidimicrobiales bacterium]|nr:molybdenum cofactor guanylyltransferase [Acidimicrobiales bacterium]
MGADKALLVVDGRPLARRTADVLHDAGAAEVLVVGGDAAALRALGLDVVVDRHPGDGPLGGLVTALDAAAEELVAVLACDLPFAAPAGVAAVVDALAGDEGAAWAAPVSQGQRQLLHAAYRRSRRAHWAEAFAAGERSLRRPASLVPGVEVGDLEPAWLLDADTPEDLPPRGG